MSVHSLPIQRSPGDRDEALPPSDAVFGRPRQRILIRRSWVSVIEEQTASDRDATRPIIVSGAAHTRRAA